MSTDGVLEVHDNVVFKANTAETGDGGAVSLPFNIVFHLHGRVV
jgi:predicted outer membrane repeat protein